MKPKLIVLSGAGISAESGLKTFRDSDGLWENYNVYDVATPQAWEKNQLLVLDFYNKRREQVVNAKPNLAHELIARLENFYDVTVITQNIDNLHERAGSHHVLHLHGEIMKSRSTVDHTLIYDVEGANLNNGDLCEKGSQLRPHIVWFGEMVPMMDKAILITQQADIFVVIGSSLQVYPAAGLISCARNEIPKYLIDPASVAVSGIHNLQIIKKTATLGMQELYKLLTTSYS